MNSTRKASLAALLGTLAFGISMGASAAELGFYVGGQYGKTSKDEDTAAIDSLMLAFYHDIDFVPSTRSNRFESDDTTWGFFGGYRLFQNLAFEAGYLSLSKDVLREYATGLFVQPSASEPEAWSTSIGVRSTGFSLSVVGVLPITYNWELFARGGVFLASNTLSLYAVNDQGVGGTDELTESSADYLVSVGAGYTIAEVYQLRAEYQRVFDAGSKEYGEQDTDSLTIGITVRF